MIKTRLLAFLLTAGIACSVSEPLPVEPFTVVMLPDTQGMLDFTRQTAEGFAIDSSELFIEQMQYVASRGESHGGDVAFVTSVGDVWQHVVTERDAEHEARGVEAIGGHRMVHREGTLGFEIPKALEGYRLISDAEIPFAVAPGNHDYDAWFAVEGEPIRRPSGQTGPPTHIGGLDQFGQAFGSDSEFFRDREWYVSGLESGGSSAQVFSAGGYRFLHLAFEMLAGDDVLAWAQEVIERHPGLPTVISTHDFLNPRGERLPNRMNLKATDPEGHNSAEEIWQTFVRDSDQIFMVLCGHEAGQAWRVDENDFGHDVYQILANFQARGQAGLDAGQPRRPNGDPVPGGDGWLREMTFHMDVDPPIVEIRTYSTHYESYSSDLSTYADWYRDREQPDMTDDEFLAADEFTIVLRDFHERFGEPGEF